MIDSNFHDMVVDTTQNEYLCYKGTVPAETGLEFENLKDLEFDLSIGHALVLLSFF